MNRDREALETALGARLVSSRPLQGGDLSQVVRAALSDGRTLVVKRGGRVASEARMLGAMRAAGARTPEVLAQVGDLLALEALPETAPSHEGWSALGRDLRRLHACTGPAYGWTEDYGFGPLPIDNAPRADWPSFWAEARLLPFLPHLPAPLARRVEAVAERLPELVPKAPPAALLHGDLWTGNVLFMAGAAALIDPACYHGHTEVDLAMLDLFGSPPAAFWQGYGPEEPERAARRPVYQLFPALVHLRLFGSGYAGLVRRLLDQVLGTADN
ncbi:fructosamine kinase family protein [Salipiger mangrovisoli]|uniref:Fructosamine kinase family protein n=1 Tax=Salipiger mangrovisoli TaxID=2865933 RepID=A0ABR9WVD1_9RHOB|nr:fructosamine kinase family protein [Salipiger mangrovisoli]MBE9635232.1 fructosamine kinase family protein [Salipiger mangrovisoli]